MGLRSTTVVFVLNTRLHTLEQSLCARPMHGCAKGHLDTVKQARMKVNDEGGHDEESNDFKKDRSEEDHSVVLQYPGNGRRNFFIYEEAKAQPHRADSRKIS